MRVRIQVIKVYDIEVDAVDADEATAKAYQIQTTEIEATGELIDSMTDHAEADALDTDETIPVGRVPSRSY